VTPPKSSFKLVSSVVHQSLPRRARLPLSWSSFWSYSSFHWPWPYWIARPVADWVASLQ